MEVIVSEQVRDMKFHDNKILLFLENNSAIGVIELSDNQIDILNRMN